MLGGRRDDGWPASGSRLRGQQLRFEAGDALVEEAVVGASTLQAFFQGALPGGEVADALPERSVLGAEPAGGVAVVLVLGVAELAEQLADAGALARISACAALRACSAPPVDRMITG